MDLSGIDMHLDVIPTEFSVKTPNLASMYLTQCNLSGSIPTEFGNLSQLSALAIEDSPSITGTLPTALGTDTNGHTGTATDTTETETDTDTNARHRRRHRHRHTDIQTNPNTDTDSYTDTGTARTHLAKHRPGINRPCAGKLTTTLDVLRFTNLPGLTGRIPDEWATLKLTELRLNGNTGLTVHSRTTA